MLKLLIVEDEMTIRRGLRNSIKWHDNDILVCGEAGNGKEALSYIKELEPDLMLLDMRMPVMNGLELLRILSEEKSPVRVVVFSGYDDFEYVRKAMTYGARDYLLKPSTTEEILSVILRQKQEIYDNRQQQQYLAQIQPLLLKSMPLLKERFLTRLVKNQLIYGTDLNSEIEQFQLALNPGPASAVILFPDMAQDTISSITPRDHELTFFSINNIASEIMSPHYTMECLQVEDHLVLLFSHTAKLTSSELVPLLKTVQKEVQKHLGITITVSKGMIHPNLGDIHHSYTEALTALEYRFWSGGQAIVDYAEISLSEPDSFHYPEEAEKEVLKTLKQLNGVDRIPQAVNHFFSYCSPVSTDRYTALRTGQLLALAIYRHCIHQGASNTYLKALLEEVTAVQQSETLELLCANNITLALSAHRLLNDGQTTSKTVNEAMAYIQDNFPSDIGLESTADHVGITPSYLSTLFKQHCGIGFLEYLHRTRIDEACNRIKENPWLRGYELAKQVGYRQESYFYKVFKKLTGMTPSQFKKNL